MDGPSPGVPGIQTELIPVSSSQLRKILALGILVVSALLALIGVGQVVVYSYFFMDSIQNYSENSADYYFYFWQITIIAARVPFALLFPFLLLAGIIYLRREKEVLIVALMFAFMLYLSFNLINAAFTTVFIIEDAEYDYIFKLSLVEVVLDASAAVLLAILISLYALFMKKFITSTAAYQSIDGGQGISRFNPNVLKKIILILSIILVIINTLPIGTLVISVVSYSFAITDTTNDDPVLFIVWLVIIQSLDILFCIVFVAVLVLGVKATRQELKQRMIIAMGFLIVYFSACIFSGNFWFMAFSLKPFYTSDLILAIPILGGFILGALFSAILFVFYALLLKSFHAKGLASPLQYDFN